MWSWKKIGSVSFVPLFDVNWVPSVPWSVDSGLSRSNAVQQSCIAPLLTVFILFERFTGVERNPSIQNIPVRIWKSNKAFILYRHFTRAKVYMFWKIGVNKRKNGGYEVWNDWVNCYVNARNWRSSAIFWPFREITTILWEQICPQTRSFNKTLSKPQGASLFIMNYCFARFQFSMPNLNVNSAYWYRPVSNYHWHYQVLHINLFQTSHPHLHQKTVPALALPRVLRLPNSPFCNQAKWHMQTELNASNQPLPVQHTCEIEAPAICSNQQQCFVHDHARRKSSLSESWFLPSQKHMIDSLVLFQVGHNTCASKDTSIMMQTIRRIPGGKTSLLLRAMLKVVMNSLRWIVVPRQ